MCAVVQTVDSRDGQSCWACALWMGKLMLWIPWLDRSLELVVQPRLGAADRRPLWLLYSSCFEKRTGETFIKFICVS